MNKNKRVIAFIDDHIIQVTRPKIQLNTKQLQRKVISKLEFWASSNNAIFNLKKTLLTHFIQNTRKIIVKLTSLLALKIEGQPIYEQKRVKLFKVIFDQKFIHKKYIAKVLQKEIIEILSLKWLKNLYPKST